MNKTNVKAEKLLSVDFVLLLRETNTKLVFIKTLTLSRLVITDKASTANKPLKYHLSFDVLSFVISIPLLAARSQKRIRITFVYLFYDN